MWNKKLLTFKTKSHFLGEGATFHFSQVFACLGDKEIWSVSTVDGHVLGAYNHWQIPLGYRVAWRWASQYWTLSQWNQMMLWYWLTCLSAWKGDCLIVVRIFASRALSGRVWALLGIAVSSPYAAELHPQRLLRNQVWSGRRVKCECRHFTNQVRRGRNWLWNSLGYITN